MEQNSMFIMAVALITWGGVFFYLLRLHFLARDIETKINQHDERFLEQPLELPSELQNK